MQATIILKPGQRELMPDFKLLWFVTMPAICTSQSVSPVESNISAEHFIAAK